MNALTIAALFVPLLLGARLLWLAWAARRRPSTPAGEALPALGAEAEGTLAALVPSAALAVDTLPQIDATPLLKKQTLLPPPAVDLTVLGVDEDREAAEDAVWRAVRRALEAREAPSRGAGTS